MRKLGSNVSAASTVPITEKLVVRLTAVLALLMLGVTAWLAIEYRNTPILGLHAFRQTQTALTTYWACKAGFRAAYWTPVVGYPWAIPFELPIYQWIVALISCPSGLGLDMVGRLVSYAFWIGCLAPAFQMSKRLFVERAPLYFWTFSLLFLAAPIYLFWGRSFLMESAALLFSLYFVAFSLELSKGGGRWRDAVFCGVFLTLAILQKSTTVLPLLIFALLYLLRAWPDLKARLLRSEMLWKGCVAYIIPFAIGVFWVKYSDCVKTANAVGAMLTSSQTSRWNFGTLPARFSEALWGNVIWHRVAEANIGGVLGAVLILAGFLFTPRRRVLILSGVGLFLLYFMVFENLLFVHEYYPISNTVYLIFALAAAVAGLVEERPRLAPVMLVGIVSVVAINLHAYFTGPLFAQERHVYDDTDPVLAVAKFVREHTAPMDPILVYGDDWSSEIPYYAQRKGFVVPRFFPEYLGPLDQPEKYLDRGQGAILVCGAARSDVELRQKIALRYPHWPVGKFEMCDMYLRGR